MPASPPFLRGIPPLLLLLAGGWILPTLHAERLRIACANITSGNYQSYDPGEGIRIFQGIDPDVALIQEFNYGTNSSTDVRSFVTSAFGSTFSWFQEGGAQIPNGIVSKHPIIASGEWDDVQVSNRDFAWARIDLPGDKDLWAVSVHFLTSSAATRNLEAKALVEFIQANVRSSDYLVIGGDFNSDARTEAQFSTLSAVVNVAAPHPVDRNNNGNTNAGRSKPYDSVFPDADLKALQTPVIIGSSTFSSGLVVDTRVYSPISEISPALASDSGATNMQHMAVVKDFLLPAPPDPPVLPLLSIVPAGAPMTSLRITFTSTSTAVYEVQASERLDSAPAWTPLGQITAASTTTTAVIVKSSPASGQVVDASLGAVPRRFYRIIRK